MMPNDDSRYPQRLMSVADLVRPSHAQDSQPVRQDSSRPALHSNPLWGPSSRGVEQQHPSPLLRPETHRHQQPSSHHLTREAPVSSGRLWNNPSARKETHELTMDADLKKYAKLLTPFIYKLYCLVNDDSTNALCEWANGGNAFIVHDPVTFSAKILPRYFKHNQFSSFVRQLNKYSFHKLTPGACIFGHTHFLKNRPDLLLHIGPPRPQERAAEKGRTTTVGRGGAPLSSLQRDTTSSQKGFERPAVSHSVVAPHMNHEEHRMDKGLERSGAPRYRTPSEGEETTVNVMQPMPSASSAVTVRPLGYGPNGLESGPKINSGHIDSNRIVRAVTENAVTRGDIEEIVRRVHGGLVQEVTRDLEIAKNERDEFLHRLRAVERRNDELLREIHNCYRRMEDIERRHEIALGRKRLLEDPNDATVLHTKRLRTEEDFTRRL
eukprot:GFKZ01005452.1.p1 GENE.GFKZ01005452.1~~GFKZ01005452.1.p1  ORF type:complete len:437 (+),score=39.15 GFKZ01005452.1:471-1781(+)